MEIDRTLLRALFSGLAINGPKGYERCMVLLSEPEDIIERRSELQKRPKCLLFAKAELIEAFI